jgi:hypothetical protein
MKNLLKLFSFVFLLSLLTGCGEEIADNSESCKVCHSDANFQEVTFQYNQSVHKSGAIAVAYAGGRASCAECHSSEGFIEFAATGDVGGDISAPSAWECKTCHSLHTTFDSTDYALRLAEPISFIFDTTVVADFGNGNLCSNCHQNRRAEPNMDVPGATFEITSSHYGPHHGPQANLVYGAGFAEIAGSKSYAAPGGTQHFTESCTGCHMGEYADGAGGHTLNPTLNSCDECHSGAEDFDINDFQTEIAAQLEELRDLLVAAHVLHQDTVTLEYHPVNSRDYPGEGIFDMEEAQAFFNWIGIEEDRSLGAHNPNYIEALLTNSIEALN